MYIHNALNELITCGETEIAAANLRITITRLSRTAPGQALTGFRAQLQVSKSQQPEHMLISVRQVLEKVFRDISMDSSAATSEVNAPKNRYLNKIPCKKKKRNVVTNDICMML